MSTPHQSDTERDAWLSEALRHAPDAQAAPPPALSDAILREARAATNSARAPVGPPARDPWAALWRWLARPPVAAGFASVTVATLIGLMWRDEPMDQTIARPPAVGATAPPAATAPPPAAPVAAADEGPRSVAKAEVAPAAPRKLAAPKPMQQPAQERIEPNPARATPPAPARDDPAPFAERGATADAVAPAPKLAQAPVSTAPAAPAPALRTRESSFLAAPENKVEPARETRPAAFDTLLASVAAQPERWGWERDGTVRPMHPALQGWLARADAATATRRWRSPADTASSGEAAVLRLYRDGTLAATLRLDSVSVGLVPGPRAVLPPAELAALQQALDDATR